MTTTPTRLKADPNMYNQAVDLKGLVFHPIGEGAIAFEGFPWWRPGAEFFRLPLAIKDGLREMLRWVAAQPSGGVMRFVTDSRRLAVRARLDRDESSRNSPRNLESGFDVYVGDGAGKQYAQCLCPDERSVDYVVGLAKPLPAGLNQITLYTPILNPLLEVRIGLDEGATLAPPPAYAIGRPILFYGSSITQGFCASRPGLTYPARICRALDAPLINLGFGGNCRGDLEVAQAIADLDLACLVLDYDHNTPDLDHLRRTHAPFFTHIRQRRPELPVVMVTAPTYHNDPAFFGSRARVILDTYEAAKAAGDAHVYFVHGGMLYPEPWQDCTVDRLHPNDVGFKAMAEGILPAVRQALGGHAR